MSTLIFEMILKWLRIIILACLFALNGVWQAEAQSRNRPTWITFSVGHQEYNGDFGNEILAFEVGYDWTLGLELDQYLGNLFDFELSMDYAELDYTNAFSTTIINANIMLNVKPMGSKYHIKPYLGTGFGISPFFNNGASAENGVTLHLPAQVGFDYQLNDNMAVGLKARYNRSLSDDLDGIGEALDMDGINHDDFIVYSVGFKISINKTRDKDGDGISDKNDLCPDTYGTSFWGCPDSDSDGIPDNEDACPNNPGRSVLGGCPDSDGDGIVNSRDKCPETAGVFENEGCPRALDEDNDGITDAEDDCPQQAGTAANNGCPQKEEKQLTENMKENLQKLGSLLQFEDNSSVVDSTAYDALKQLADYMQSDSDLRLIIRGHTNTSRSAAQNLELSVDRANAVKDYLIEQGIQANRIAAFGYGDTRPEISNDSQDGREQVKNSRIELHLYYQ
ncbi:OmpA family protein [Balneolaceae bacterium YR4-1]|uniref:OmpA family protein n=1 Tax=Halalkalibaculum roseum TaxID=2709311 RepID=A0A6M1SU11_9BACT|nr:OmpA family protein [Halalkalibaculum roseum]NGP75636.1 OmpA family protein [Halalkalibaculum roseum]